MSQELMWTFKYMIRLLSPKKTFFFTLETFKKWQDFWQSYYQYKRLASSQEQPSVKYLYPCLDDNIGETIIDPIYFYQDTWAFKKIINQAPNHHIDVGSHHKFVAFLSTIIPVTMIDIRPLPLQLDSLKFKEGSILNLPFKDQSIESLSSLCVIEHIGLGRYGDSLDPNGTEKAILELKRIVKVGGHLYISLPIDDENKTFFNAHRSFAEPYIINLFNSFKVIEKKYIFNNEILSQKLSGFGIGLYHLQRSK